MKTYSSILICLVFVLAASTALEAACALANPSFEVPGTGGSVFRGWEQFGQFGTFSTAIHGSAAAVLYGQNNGSENVSGYWQQLDSNPGEQWKVSGYVLIPGGQALQGANQALVNLEWRNSSGAMISYESHSVADFSTPAGQYIPFEWLSPPAPAATVAVRLVLGALQSAQDPAQQVVFDQITCYSTSYPTVDDVQWNDFPGGRSLQWSGRTWRVKGPGYYGPGPNNFSDSQESVWVDAQDRLHMTIRQIESAWNSTEVVLEDTLGYGDYIFTTVGDLGQLGANTVLGLFLWQYSTCWDAGDAWWNPYNEFDIEYSRWGNPGNEIGQFVAQPWDWPGNIFRYDASFGPAEISSHAIRWLPHSVEGRAWRGGPQDESPATLISSWSYTGPHIPRPEQPRVHINLWYFGSPPSITQEVVLPAFTYITPGGVSAEDDMYVPGVLKLTNYPNPFSGSTTIAYSLKEAGEIQVAIYDLRGRLIRSYSQSSAPKGPGSITWDGRDVGGALVSTGLYFIRMQAGDYTQTRKMLLLH